MNKVTPFLFLLILVIACNTSKKSPEYMTPATGKPGDMILFLDSIQWKGTLGTELRKVFSAEVPGLPRPEPMFNLKWVHPNKKIHFLTEIRNLIFVFTLDQNTRGSKIMKESFSPETLARIKSDSSFFIYTEKDEYSKGQEVMYLYGDTEQNLIHHLHQNKQRIIDFFNTAEKKRLESAIFKTKTTKSITDFLQKEQQCELRVPFGFKLADKQKDFAWLRAMEPEVDKDIFISWKRYESEYQLLPDSIIAWRDAIARKYLFGDPQQPESYLVTAESPFKPVLAKQVNFNNHFAMEVRGLWKTHAAMTMGGPFLSYTLVDEKKNLLYYIEGFAYSPGKEQREIMRELETILWTFKTSDVAKAN